ncbi:MAG: hypothetical protein N3D82_03810 [Ignisphaera sp.]|nr:hypothetical protein [Ignisphaera sp.]MCX8168133.1 hypothetical protein [Ignisphaera sp.]MDW8085432.1 hypothetical protein [Ignisphaera sp.]
MICILASDRVPVETLSKVISNVIQEARKVETTVNSINIVFYSRDIENAFKYKNVFTRYVDIGVRVYVEDRPSQLMKILAPCTVVYTAIGDHVVEELSKKIGITIKRV